MKLIKFKLNDSINTNAWGGVNVHTIGIGHGEGRVGHLGDGDTGIGEGGGWGDGFGNEHGQCTGGGEGKDKKEVEHYETDKL